VSVVTVNSFVPPTPGLSVHLSVLTASTKPAEPRIRKRAPTNRNFDCVSIFHNMHFENFSKCSVLSRLRGLGPCRRLWLGLWSGHSPFALYPIVQCAHFVVAQQLGQALMYLSFFTVARRPAGWPTFLY